MNRRIDAPTELAYRTLSAAPEGMKAERLARAIFKLKGKIPKELAAMMLRQALGGDDQFEEEPGGAKWRLAEDLDPLHINNAVFTVVDLETTGGHPGYNRIIQVGAFRVERGRVGDCYMSMVHPGRRIPIQISLLTGIYDEHVADAPPFGEIAPRLAEFIGDTVFVGHNARFDSGFIDTEMKRSGMPEMNNPVLCTLRLSRRLMRECRSHSLGAVAGSIGIEFADERHTAHGDAWATAKLLTHFLGLLEQQGIDTLEGVMRFQYSRKKK